MSHLVGTGTDGRMMVPVHILIQYLFVTFLVTICLFFVIKNAATLYKMTRRHKVRGATLRAKQGTW